MNEQTRMEEWKEYFMDVLEGVEWRVVVGGRVREGRIRRVI